MASAAYPGTFNPPTVAHLAVAAAARRRLHLDRVDMIVSQVPLGKEGHAAPPVGDRVAILAQVGAREPWLRARSTTAQLLVDVAAGYDYLVVGADKWAQLLDPVWYGGSEAERDRALKRLPRVVVVPRPPFPVPAGPCPVPAGVVVLEVAAHHGSVSSSGARAGRPEWMLPEAVAYARRTGSWATT
jgi:nicotinic acid mononucleotide adenylyltransferase